MASLGAGEQARLVPPRVFLMLAEEAEPCCSTYQEAREMDNGIDDVEVAQDKVLVARAGIWRSAQTEQEGHLHELVRARDIALAEQRARHVRESLVLSEQRHALARGLDWGEKIAKLFGWTDSSQQRAQNLPTSPVSVGIADATTLDGMSVPSEGNDTCAHIHSRQDDDHTSENAVSHDTVNISTEDELQHAREKNIHNGGLKLQMRDSQEAGTGIGGASNVSRNATDVCLQCVKLRQELEIAVTDRTLAEAELVTLRRVVAPFRERRKRREYSLGFEPASNGGVAEIFAGQREQDGHIWPQRQVCGATSSSEAAMDQESELCAELVRLERLRAVCVLRGVEQRGEVPAVETANSLGTPRFVSSDDVPNEKRWSEGDVLASKNCNKRQQAEVNDLADALSATVAENARQFEELTRRRLLRLGVEADLWSARKKLQELLPSNRNTLSFPNLDGPKIDRRNVGSESGIELPQSQSINSFGAGNAVSEGGKAADQKMRKSPSGRIASVHAVERSAVNESNNKPRQGGCASWDGKKRFVSGRYSRGGKGGRGGSGMGKRSTTTTVTPRFMRSSTSHSTSEAGEGVLAPPQRQSSVVDRESPSPITTLLQEGRQSHEPRENAVSTTKKHRSGKPKLYTMPSDHHGSRTPACTALATKCATATTKSTPSPPSDGDCTDGDRTPNSLQPSTICIEENDVLYKNNCDVVAVDEAVPVGIQHTVGDVMDTDSLEDTIPFVEADLPQEDGDNKMSSPTISSPLLPSCEHAYNPQVVEASTKGGENTTKNCRPFTSEDVDADEALVADKSTLTKPASTKRPPPTSNRGPKAVVCSGSPLRSSQIRSPRSSPPGRRYQNARSALKARGGRGGGGGGGGGGRGGSTYKIVQDGAVSPVTPSGEEDDAALLAEEKRAAKPTTTACHSCTRTNVDDTAVFVGVDVNVQLTKQATDSAPEIIGLDPDVGAGPDCGPDRSSSSLEISHRIDGDVVIGTDKWAIYRCSEDGALGTEAEENPAAVTGDGETAISPERNSPNIDRNMKSSKKGKMAKKAVAARKSPPPPPPSPPPPPPMSSSVAGERQTKRSARPAASTSSSFSPGKTIPTASKRSINVKEGRKPSSATMTAGVVAATERRGAGRGCVVENGKCVDRTNLDAKKEEADNIHPTVLQEATLPSSASPGPDHDEHYPVYITEPKKVAEPDGGIVLSQQAKENGGVNSKRVKDKDAYNEDDKAISIAGIEPPQPNKLQHNTLDWTCSSDKGNYQDETPAVDSVTIVEEKTEKGGGREGGRGERGSGGGGLGAGAGGDCCSVVLDELSAENCLSHDGQTVTLQARHLRAEIDSLRSERAELEDTIAQLNVAAAQLYLVQYTQMKAKCRQLQRVVLGSDSRPTEEASRYGHSCQEIMHRLKSIGVTFFRRRVGGCQMIDGGASFFPKGLARALTLVGRQTQERGCQTEGRAGSDFSSTEVGWGGGAKAGKDAEVQVSGGIDAEDEPLMEQQVYALLGKLDLTLKGREETLSVYRREAQEGAREARALLSAAAAQCQCERGEPGGRWGARAASHKPTLVGGREGPAGAPRPALHPTNLLFTAAAVLDRVPVPAVPSPEQPSSLSSSSPQRSPTLDASTRAAPAAIDGRLSGDVLCGISGSSCRKQLSPADQSLLELADEIVAALEEEQRRSDASAERRRYAAEGYRKDGDATALGRPPAGVPPLIWGMGIHLVGKLARAFRTAVEARGFEREVADADLVAAVTLGRSSGGDGTHGPYPWNLEKRMVSALQNQGGNDKDQRQDLCRDGEQHQTESEVKEIRHGDFAWRDGNYTHFRSNRTPSPTGAVEDGEGGVLHRASAASPRKIRSNPPMNASLDSSVHCSWQRRPVGWGQQQQQQQQQRQPAPMRHAKDIGGRNGGYHGVASNRTVVTGHGGNSRARATGHMPSGTRDQVGTKVSSRGYSSVAIAGATPGTTRRRDQEQQHQPYNSAAVALVEAAAFGTVKPLPLHARPASASAKGRSRPGQSGSDRGGHDTHVPGVASVGEGYNGGGIEPRGMTRVEHDDRIRPQSARRADECGHFADKRRGRESAARAICSTIWSDSESNRQDINCPVTRWATAIGLPNSSSMSPTRPTASVTTTYNRPCSESAGGGSGGIDETGGTDSSRAVGGGCGVIDTRTWSSSVAKPAVFRCHPQHNKVRFEENAGCPTARDARAVPGFLVLKERELAERERVVAIKGRLEHRRVVTGEDDVAEGENPRRLAGYRVDSGGEFDVREEREDAAPSLSESPETDVHTGYIGENSCRYGYGFGGGGDPHYDVGGGTGAYGSPVSSARIGEASIDTEKLLPDAGEQAFFEAWKPMGYGDDIYRYD